MARRRDFKPISAAISEITTGIEPATALAKVQSAWPDAVGETIARWATPVAERGGVVTFACTDSMVAHELQMIKPELLEKLTNSVSDWAPKDLKFVIR